MGRRRQPRGAGSTYQDKHGQWWAKVPTRSGPRRARCASAKDAEATRRKLVQERDAGINIRAAQQPLRAWLEHWLAAIADRIAPSTRIVYKRYCEHMAPQIGHIRLEALEPADVRDMLLALRAAGLSARSCAHARGVLRNALGMAMKDGLLLRNVAGLTDSPRCEEYQAHALTETETEAFLLACEAERLGFLFVLAVVLGMRRGELLALRWADLNWQARTLTVATSKSKAGRRTLPLTDWLIERFRACWAEQQEERQARGVDWEEHGLIFPTANGRRVNESTCYYTYKRILKRAGLSTTIRMHDLRHTAITDWIASGDADPRTAQALAGHTNPLITMRVYAKARSEKLRTVVETVERKRRKQA